MKNLQKVPLNSNLKFVAREHRIYFLSAHFMNIGEDNNKKLHEMEWKKLKISFTVSRQITLPTLRHHSYPTPHRASKRSQQPFICINLFPSRGVAHEKGGSWKFFSYFFSWGDAWWWLLFIIILHFASYLESLLKEILAIEV